MTDVPTLFSALAQNLALLLSLVFVYSLVAPRLTLIPAAARGSLTGLLFGVIALIGMFLRIQVAPGVNFDSRNVAVALAGVFGGPASAATAGSLVSAYRLWLGGIGASAGVAAILTAAALGAWVHWRWGPRVREFGPWQFLLLGAVLAASGLLWTLTLPDPDLAWRMLKVFAFPVGVLYPLATMLAGLLLSHAHEERERVERRRREAEVLAQLAQTINASLDLDAVLQGVAEGAKRLCECDSALVALREPDSEIVSARYRIGTRYRGYDTVRIEAGKGIGGQALLTGRPFRTDNYAGDSRISKEYLPVVQEGKIVAVMAVPIRSEARVEGLLYVGSQSARRFTDAEEAILVRLADHAAIAIRNSRLYEAAERRRQAAESLAEAGRLVSQSLDPEEVAERIAESVVRLFDAKASGVFRLEPGSGSLVGLAVCGDHGPTGDETLVYPRGTGVIGLAVGRRQPVVTPNLLADPQIVFTREMRARLEQAPYRAVLAIPLIAQEEVFGALSVCLSEGRVFGGDDIRLAQAFADQVAVALQNARLYDEALRRRREAEEIARVGRFLTETLDVSAVAERVVEGALELLGAQSCTIRLVQPDGSLLCLASGGIARNDFEPGFRTPPGVGLAGLAVAGGRPVWSRDDWNDPRVSLTDDMRDRLVRSGVHAVLAVPLRVEGKVIGALVMGDRQVRDFSESEVALLETFADRAAVALENSRLYGELRAALEEVEASQRHVIETERLRALGELAGGVAHTFNNALAIVLGRVELLLARTRSPNVRRQLRVIEQTAKDAARTVKRIEEFARMRQARPFQAVDLNQLVDEMVELTRPRWKEEAKASGISYEVVTEKGSLPPVAGDPSELREALTNLMFNALDAMPSGGRITFRTGAEGEDVFCAVTDTGIGMPPEVRQRVFDPFFTTKGERGSGLGLSIVYGVITRHGGRVDAESQAGEGTSFTIRLPLGRDIPEVPREVSPPVPQRSGKILVIDDEPELLEILGELLTAQGHAVTVCSDGQSGLSRFREGPFDLVITDLGMPGISGWEVVKQVKRSRPGTPVALLTGWGDQIALEEARARGADFLMTKPFTPEDIQAVIAQALAS
ncbi:MAG: GAF domain-containing protein [Candidatus Rokuibacteriota bacterium]